VNVQKGRKSETIKKISTQNTTPKRGERLENGVKRGGEKPRKKVRIGGGKNRTFEEELNWNETKVPGVSTY